MANKEIQIPGKLTSIAAERRVADASQIWDGEYQMDQETGADQSTINNRVKRHISEHTEAISEISSALDILNGDEETEGSVQEAVLSEATRAMAVEEDLRQLYDTINANDIIVGDLPDSGQEEGKIYRVPGDVNEAAYADYMWYNDDWVLMATFTIANEPLLVGLYTCDTDAVTAAKTVAATGFQIPASGGAIKIKMENANTANNATLNINSTGAKPLFYDGARASSTNSWEEGEIIEVYYDPTAGAYYANNTAGGGKFSTGEKVRQIGIDTIPTTGSGNLVKSDGVSEVIGLTSIVGKKYLNLDIFYNGINKPNYKIVDGVIQAGSASQSVTYTTNLVKKGSILKVKKTGSNAATCRIGVSTAFITDETLTETVLTMLLSRTFTDEQESYVIVPFDGYIAYYKNSGIYVSVYNADVLQDNSVLDVSELNGGSAYASLGDALAAVPSTLRKGGMSIRFINSNNEYVNYLLRIPTFSSAEFIATSNWQKIDDTALQIPLLSGVKFSTGMTLSKTAVTDSGYNSILLQVYAGDKFYVKGYAGTAYKIYATYDSEGARIRLGDSSNDGVIEIADGEKYLVLNIQASKNKSIIYLSSPTPSRQLYEIMAAIDNLKNDVDDINTEFTKLNDEIDDLSSNNGIYKTATYIIEQGNISVNSGGNTNTDSSKRIRTKDYIVADAVQVNPGNGEARIFGYDANNERIDYTDWVISTDIYKISGAVKYRVIFAYTDDAAITPEDYESLGASIYVIKNGESVRTTIQVLSSSQKEIARNNIGAISEDENYPTFNNEYLIEWKTGAAGGYVIQGNGTLKNTSLKNEVGVVDIRGCKTLKFNFYIRKGGDDTGRRGFLVTTAAGAILLQSTEYSKSQDTGPIDVVLNDIPSEAALLYISWSATYANTQHYLISNVDIGILYSDIGILYGDIGALNSRVSVLEAAEESNVENAAIQLYRTVRYNNNDYSYTRLNYITDLIRFPDAQLPAPVVFETKVDNTAQYRHLTIADNHGDITGDNIGAYTIALDLTSEQVEVYNLEPGKDYYYKVYKDNNPTAVIGGGLITTTGQIRFVKIAADVATNEHDWIDNVRDLGGWPASGNRRLRYGVIFRGEQLNNDDETVTYITQAGIQELRRLGVSAELDLRGGAHTQSVLGSDVAYANIALDLWFYRLNIYNTVASQAQRFAGAIRQILTWLETGEGTYIHCAGGCDRTGALCAMIEGLCGVSENDINHDYEISNRSRAREYYTIAGGGNYDGDFKFAMEYIKGLIEYNGHIYVYYRGSYYDAEATVTDYTPVPLTDATLIANLAANNYGSLQTRFERLMCGIGGLTKNEAERLRTVLLS